MELEQAIKYAIDGQAILFAGSGLSYGAKNAQGNSPKTGQALACYLASKCDIPEQTSLDIVAEIYQKEASIENLLEILRQEYTITEVTQSQITIMSLPWKRVFTTNYDHVIELAAQKNGKIFASTVAEDAITCTDNVCVHLNGDIERLDSSTIKSSFRLTDNSYASKELDGCPGYELFKSDLQNARAIIVVGYSALSDLDIKRLLSCVKHKTIFINKPNPNKVDKLVEQYGELYAIGIDSFATNIQKTQESYFPTVEHFFSCFEKYKPQGSTGDLTSYSDVVDFFAKGVQNEQSYSRTEHGEYKYYVTRTHLSRILNPNQRRKVTVIHSDMGNGKTVFLNMLKRELYQNGVEVFSFQRHTDSIENEIKWICGMNTSRVVIFDNFEQWKFVLMRFGYEKHTHGKNLWFVLASRSKVYSKTKSTLPNLLQVANNDIASISIDTLDKMEVQEFASKLSTYGLLEATMNPNQVETYIQEACHGHFSEVLLKVFKSSAMYQRMKDLLRNSNSISIPVKRTGIFILLMDYMNIDLKPVDLLDLFNVDANQLSTEEYTWIDELIDIESNQYKVYSSIIAKAFLEDTISISDIIDTLIIAVQAADKMNVSLVHETSYKTYESILVNLLSHSHFMYWTSKPEYCNEIIRYYDQVRQTTFCNQNSLFWSQFASAYIDCKQWEPAKRCLNNSFALAQKKRFIPYQTETVYARLLLEKLIDDLSMGMGDADRIINDLNECITRLNKHLNDPKNNRLYRVRRYTLIEQVWQFGNILLTTKHLQQFIGLCTKMRSQLLSETKDPYLSFEAAECIKKLDAVIEDAKKKQTKSA